MKKTVRLAGIAYESLVNGPGIRRVFFAQGCKHNCKGCFNPETHSFDKGIVLEIDKLIKYSYLGKNFLTVSQMKTIVPEFISNNSQYERLDVENNIAE